MAMPTLANVNQIAATAGYAPRLNLADALALQTPQLYADRSFAQQQRSLELQQQAEQTRQSQQRGANIISTAGTAIQGGMYAADKGWLGPAYDAALQASNKAFGTQLIAPNATGYAAPIGPTVSGE